MYNELVAVVVSYFKKAGSEKDKNGSDNVWLTPVAGQIPNRAMVVAGTVAESAGLVAGRTLLVMINETEPDATYGRQFNHTVLGEVGPLDILSLRKELGKAGVLDVTTSQAAPVEGTPTLTTSALGNAKPAATTGQGAPAVAKVN